MKKKHREDGGGQEWLNTYADMITLVLTFFVLLYSISNVNITKLEQIAQAMQKELGIQPQVSLEEIPDELKYPQVGESAGGYENPGTSQTPTSTQAIQQMADEIQQYLQSNEIDATAVSTDNVIYIRFKNELLFDPDSSGLREESKEVLDRLGSILEDKAGDILAVYINGHTAQAPNSPINDRILSSERADHVAIYLEDHTTLDPKMLISRGYGRNYPIADNSTKEGREQNRRVDMIILGRDFDKSEIESGDMQVFDPLSPIDVPDMLDGQQEGTDQ